jgi:hypothetical protein
MQINRKGLFQVFVWDGDFTELTKMQLGHRPSFF